MLDGLIKLKRRAFNLSTILPLAFLAAISAIYTSVGAIPEKNFGQDVVYLYDWAWRINNGQITHHDIPTMFGSGYGYLCALFLRWNHYDAVAFSWMNVCVTLVCILLVIVLFALADLDGSLRNKALKTLTYALLLAFGFGSTHLGMDVISHSALYNRYGFEFLLVLFVTCFLNYRGKFPSRITSMIAGGCLVALLLTKIPLFYVGILWIVLSCLRRRDFLWLSQAAAAFGVLLGTYFLVTGITWWEMMADYDVPARLRRGVIFTSSNLIEKFKSVHYFWLIATADLGLLILFIQERNYFDFIISGAIICCALLLHLTSNGATDIPLLMFLLLLALDRLSLKHFAGAVILAILAFQTSYFLYKSSLRFTQAISLASQKEKIKRLNSGHIQNLYIESGRFGAVYVDRVMEGANLIMSHVRTPERISALDFDNPFNVLLATTPPRGLPLTWEEGYTFSNRIHPTFVSAFGDVKIIIIPTETKLEHYSLWNLYGKGIRKNFTQIAESSRWILMQRTNLKTVSAK